MAPRAASVRDESGFPRGSSPSPKTSWGGCLQKVSLIFLFFLNVVSREKEKPAFETKTCFCEFVKEKMGKALRTAWHSSRYLSEKDGRDCPNTAGYHNKNQG